MLFYISKKIVIQIRLTLKIKYILKVEKCIKIIIPFIVAE